MFEDKYICVSTDDLQNKEVVENIGLNVPFLRPYELATDTAGTYEVIVHAVDFYIKKGYSEDPCFKSSKVVYSIYDETFSKPFRIYLKRFWSSSNCGLFVKGYSHKTGFHNLEFSALKTFPSK